MAVFYTHTHTHTRMHSHAHTHTHTKTHTHSLSLSLSLTHTHARSCTAEVRAMGPIQADGTMAVLALGRQRAVLLSCAGRGGFDAGGGEPLHESGGIPVVSSGGRRQGRAAVS